MNLKLIAILACWTAAALAHPVAYQGAVALMSSHQKDMSDVQIAYSATPRVAIGVDYRYSSMFGTESQYAIPRVNFLLKRWNGPEQQANLYLYGGYGIAKQGQQLQGAFFGGGEADWESRALYFSAKASTTVAPSFDNLTMYQARAGFAPYQASFEELQAWVILQSQYFPKAFEESFRIGPVLRFFYKNFLWELGATVRGNWNLNLMVHF